MGDLQAAPSSTLRLAWHAAIMQLDAELYRLRWRTAMLSLAVGVGMLLLKGGAYLHTGSVAILSDAMESVVHVVGTLAMVWSMKVILEPADDRHPYGHGRIEHFSVGFEGGMVALAGLAIIWVTSEKLWQGYEPTAFGWGLVAMIAAAVINLALGLYLRRVARRARSPILDADATHVLSDVWTSAGVALGLVAVWLSGWVLLDALIAYAVALYILYEGSKLVRGAFAGLLDEADVNVLSEVVAVLNEQRHADWIDIHSLRCRRHGDDVHIDFHLVVPGDRQVRQMHDQLDVLEEEVLARLQGEGSLLVHLDYPAPELTEDQLRQIYPSYGKPFEVAVCSRLTNDAAPSELGSELADGPPADTAT